MKAMLWSAYRLARSIAARHPAAAEKLPIRRLQLEELECRALPSAVLAAAVAAPDLNATPMATVKASSPYTPAQIRQVYGVNQLSYDGTGQTIAIVDAFDDPNILGDLKNFDATFGLADPSFTKATPKGLPAKANFNWALETSLDVEWAHVVAPKAKILLVESASDSFPDLLTAVDYARNQPGVSVVSMSWGGGEFSGETALDLQYLTTPSGHAPVAFVASSGDGGAGSEWPAASPNVLAVGGTSLTINSTTTNGVTTYSYGGESAWSGGGGGLSQYEAKPSFQASAQGYTKRSTPDVAYDADPSKGFYVYDTGVAQNGYTGWYQAGGTSAGAPQWAALIALADQGRAQNGAAPLSNAAAAVYSLPATDFHDIATGGNGYSAVSGYDFTTGRGSPIANLVVAGFVNYGAAPSGKTGTTTMKPAASTTTTHVAAAVAPAGPQALGGSYFDARAEWAIEEMLRDLHLGQRSKGDYEGLGIG